MTGPERSIFSPVNRERVRQIIEGGCDPQKLKAVIPAFIVIDTTWKCNYNCRACIDGGAAGRDPNKPDMPLDVCMGLLDYASGNGIRGIMTLGGDPFLYRYADRFLTGCAERNLPVSIVSNGSKLGEHIEAAMQALAVKHSRLRISVNADGDNYQYHTRAEFGLDSVLQSIRAVTERGGKVLVSTVVFGSQAADHLQGEEIRPNIDQLEEIAHACGEARVSTLIFIPARHPNNKHIFPLSREERRKLRHACQATYPGHIKVKAVYLFRSHDDAQDTPQVKKYAPCPSNLMRALVGPDCKIYMCTDHRGEAYAVLGNIQRPGDFGNFWHSQQRVEKQLNFDTDTRCTQTCIRYEANVAIDSMRRDFARTGTYRLGRYGRIRKNYGFEF